MSFPLIIHKETRIIYKFIHYTSNIYCIPTCVKPCAKAKSTDVKKTNKDPGLMEMMVYIYSFLPFQQEK